MAREWKKQHRLTGFPPLALPPSTGCAGGLLQSVAALLAEARFAAQVIRQCGLDRFLSAERQGDHGLSIRSRPLKDRPDSEADLRPFHP